MKKIFTLISMAFIAMSANAQDVYDAIVDGKLAPEFAAVAGDNGGVATNAADGKSIITMTAGKATVTAVGGTTPANDTEIGGAAQQIVPGAAVEGKENTYEVAQVNAWNEIKWGKGNQGDIDFWWVTGTGNPYVNMYCVQNSKDGVLVPNSYKADYVYYNPDGSLGMPITGLYYKFTASAAGAFKVKVWGNKGSRKTFVVNAATKKAERLLASGYDERTKAQDGSRLLMTVDQVDSVHNAWIGAKYTSAAKDGKTQLDSIAFCDSLNVKEGLQYVIGNGDQKFFGWLTFDVEAGEEYWVFQHSSQIGFGGFEFHEGKTADELITGIEAVYVYTTNFSTYEDEETGERVTWKGEKAVGNGQFASESPELDENDKPINIVPFGDFFRNDGSAARASYCLLPEDVLAHSAKTQALTLAVWVRAQENASSYQEAPLFAAYAQEGSDNAPLFAALYNGTMMLDNNTKYDYTGALTNDWLADKKWHYYTAVFQGENAYVFIDGTLQKEWTPSSAQAGLFSNGDALKYVCLGGNSPAKGVNDAPFDFARLLIKNSAMTAGEVKAQMLADFPGYEEYQSGDTGVNIIKTVQNSNAAIYNLAGQKVNNDFKGIVIQNGQKKIQK